MQHETFHREAAVLKALGHPKRLEIVQVIGGHGLTATDLQRMTGFPQANLSQHLRELKEARVIVAKREGKFIRYRLSHPLLLQLTRLLRDVSQPRRARKIETKPTEVKDPVCGMWVEPAASQWQVIYKGATYFFCASGCSKRFTAYPERYV